VGGRDTIYENVIRIRGYPHLDHKLEPPRNGGSARDVLRFTTHHFTAQHSPALRSAHARTTEESGAERNRFLELELTFGNVQLVFCYGEATISRLLKIIGLFCKRALQKSYDFQMSTRVHISKCQLEFTFNLLCKNHCRSD